MSKKEQGFFVKYNDSTYSMPYDTLNSARADARVVGPNLPIYHGVMVINDDGTIDNKDLYIVPKVPKRK
jgi:hypothetical protein